MSAIQFIKDHGVEKAREVVEGAPETATHFTEALGGHYAKEGMLKMKPQWLWFNSINKEWYFDFAAKDQIHLPDLKRLVESVELVDSYHKQLIGAKREDELADELEGYSERNERLKQAIADYKAIYSSDCEILDHPEDYTSPNCKKYGR
ncbi:hypothetical protein LF296_12795 [Acinetobacter vivianii]|uniref:Uncharacterized protein n=1 Tax=Acinetobacter vivianii TaxID=1776742 RepID=A0AAJ6P463_9GAMM|nr:hypothetical protein [Acinetobacter vivianii]WDZ50198.1 hypothetical protein LF296_12795 [Acinetobacter vivianii]